MNNTASLFLFLQVAESLIQSQFVGGAKGAIVTMQLSHFCARTQRDELGSDSVHVLVGTADLDFVSLAETRFQMVRCTDALQLAFNHDANASAKGFAFLQHKYSLQCHQYLWHIDENVPP
jgi:hypothetical protein